MTPGRFEALATAPVRSLRAYDPGHDLVALRRRAATLVELGANESPYGPSPHALAAARYGLGQCLRISLGTADDNDRLLAALDEVVQ